MCDVSKHVSQNFSELQCSETDHVGDDPKRCAAPVHPHAAKSTTALSLAVKRTSLPFGFEKDTSLVQSCDDCAFVVVLIVLQGRRAFDNEPPIP